MNIQFYFDIIQKWFLKSGIPIIVILFVMMAALYLSNIFICKYFSKFVKTNGDEELEKRAKTLKLMSKTISDILIVVTGSMIILNKIGINIAPLLAAAGVVGIAVGFGAQRLVEDIINGFLILLDDQIRVGDVIQIGDKSGLVEKMGLRMVVLRDISGNVHYIRNGKIDIITNMTKDYSMYVFDIGVAYKENIDKVIEIIKQIDEELRNDDEYKDNILEPIEILGLDKFEESAVIIKARTKTKPITQWAVGREFNKRLKKKFDEFNIEIPFPHRTIYTASDKTCYSDVADKKVE